MRSVVISPTISDDKLAPRGALGSGEIYVKGEWLRVPTLEVDGKTIVIRGKWLKQAIIRSEEWLETEVADPERCIRMLKEQCAQFPRADLFTFGQKLPDATPKYKYFMEPDSIAAVHLNSFKEWWEGLPQETRKNVRRSQKRGVVVELRQFDDDLVRQLVELNNESQYRQGQRNTQYGKGFDQIKKDYSSFLERSHLICAFLGNELVGFLKIVYRGQVASILNLVPKSSHSDKRPANALIAKAMELSAAKGIYYVTYGMFNYGNKGHSPLREFKIRNGFEEILVPRYYVPLTLRGTFCLRAGLHRGLLGILPHKVIKLGIDLRSQWYNFRH